MDNEDVIRDQMADTRTALAEKLEALETKVADTVDSATTNVTQTVEAVKDAVQETVTTAKDTVQETIGAVKDTVEESVEAVKGAFDLKGHVQRHPWLSFGASIAAGYLLERYVDSRSAAEPQARKAASPMSPPQNGRARRDEDQPQPAEQREEPGWLRALEPGLEKLKRLAAQVIVSTVRDIVVQAAPTTLKEPLAEAFDSIAISDAATPS
jgi:ElaB/YqjD/DUF883 family membrane-anchored ribosome-binding protein